MKKTIIVTLLLLCVHQLAEASLITFSDRTIFEKYGTISENYGFEDFSNKPYDGDHFWVLPRDWTSHGITYYGIDNIILPPNLGTFRLASNALIQNSPYGFNLIIDTSAKYTLFGIDLGYGNIAPGDYTSMDLFIWTNISYYRFNNLELPRTPKMNFFGFALDNNEFFTKISTTTPDIPTSFRIVSDNITLGHYTSPEIVPEPTTLLLLGFGISTALLHKIFL